MSDPGPIELERYHSPAGLPDPKEFHNPEVQPICRKYLDLRYRLMPYLYSAVRQATILACPSYGRSGCITPATLEPWSAVTNTCGGATS